MPVSTFLALAVVVIGVCVAASPLHVHKSIAVDLQTVWSEVVLSAGVRLHDVASLSTHIQVLDLGERVHTAGTHRNFKNMTAVLKCSGKLRGVDGKLQLDSDAEVNNRVVGKRIGRRRCCTVEIGG